MRMMSQPYLLTRNFCTTEAIWTSELGGLVITEKIVITILI